MTGWLLRGLAGGASSPTTQDYFVQLWQTEDGLPQNAVSAILQTSDGYIWIGTYGGLARFDGVQFTAFDDNNIPEMRNGRVTALCEGAGNVLWIGHETGALTRYHQGRFQAQEYPGAPLGGAIVGLTTDRAGDVWLQNGDGLLTRARDGLVLTPRSGGASGVVGLSGRGDGSVWVLRNGACSLLDHGGLTPVEFDTADTNSFVQGITPSRRGGYWVANEGRLRRRNDNAWAEDLGEAPWGLSPLAAFRETASGLLAAATPNQGLYLINPGAGRLHFDRTNGLPSDWLRSLCEDREGNLWLGVGTSGLAALRPSKAMILKPPDDWEGRPVLSVSLGRDDALSVGTEGAGVYQYHAGQWTHFTESSGLGNLYVWAVSEDAQGRLWAGTWGGGLFVKTGDRFERAPGTEDLNTPVPALLLRKDGSMWAGTGTGLVRWERGQPEWVGPQQGLDRADVRALTEDRAGRVWFGMSGGGLGCLENGAVRQFRKTHGLSSDFVWSLRVDEEDTLWIGTAGGGLNRFQQGRFAAITTSQGLPNNVICHIADDGRGYFWMSSHRGIFRVSKRELTRCADGELASVHCLAYGRGDGLPTIECSGGSQPAGCRTADGRLWFATSRGLVVVNPEQVNSNPLPPPVRIEELLVDARRIELPDPPGRLEIPPGRHRFEIRYTGLSFVVPEKVRFRHRLEALETEWVEAGAERSVTYGYIPPGHYHFRVIACNNDEVWNEDGAQLEFTVLPHFWQTSWFRITLGLGLLASVAGGVWFDTRQRMRRKLENAERQRAVERERSRIAKDIHDDLGASLTRITMLSQTARAELGQPEQAAADLDRIYSTARELTRAMDEIVWAVNPQHDTLDSLASYLGRFAQEYLRVAGVRCRLDLPSQLPAWPLSAEVRHNLFLAFKEALHNIVKHAGASEVRIALVLEARGFKVTVSDDGRGFLREVVAADASSGSDRVAPGNGLSNMRRRLTEIGGACEFESQPGMGTKVIFTIGRPK